MINEDGLRMLQAERFASKHAKGETTLTAAAAVVGEDEVDDELR